ncbi:hypothetical protein PLESTB_001430400 [Pleodorina starrii]|uniref:Uncharacterized protein n=1 Tax=Pleodorina starrii TaxID=330485 RepID=A0A9W6BWE6_9CHLO|nr:hypothetical protein PLESTB_001430400 [Pleodorina starrii]
MQLSSTTAGGRPLRAAHRCRAFAPWPLNTAPAKSAPGNPAERQTTSTTTAATTSTIFGSAAAETPPKRPLSPAVPRSLVGDSSMAAAATARPAGGARLSVIRRADSRLRAFSRIRGNGSGSGGSDGGVSRGSGPGSVAAAGSTGGTGTSGGVFRAAVGIDLGTTTSAVAVAGPDGRPVIVADDAGRAVIPSVVFVRQDGTVLVGEEAAAAAESDPANAFYGIKRLMGRTYGEALREIDAWQDTSSTASASPPSAAPSSGSGSGAPGSRGRLRSYSLVAGSGGAVEVACPALGRSLTPQEISAHLLRHLISRARTYLERQQEQQQQQQTQTQRRRQQDATVGSDSGGDDDRERSEPSVQVLDAVITVPAHFGPAQRRAVSEAARAAGLQRVTLLQEPIAAAMAYGFGSPHVPYDVLLVFDLGGGTLDLSVVEAFEGIMEVLSTSGDNYLGGDDFTAAIADWLALRQQQQQQEQQGQQRHQHQHHQQQQGQQRHQQKTHNHQHPHQSPAVLSAPAPAPSTSAPTSPLPTTPTPTTSASHSLALLRAAEAAKVALSETVAAARDAGSSSSTPASSASSNGDGGSSGGGGVSVRVRLPLPSPSGQVGSDRSGASSSGAGGGDWGAAVAPSLPPAPVESREGEQGEVGKVELSLEMFEQLVRPLLRRLWWPLEEVALATRTQLSGRLPPYLDPREESAGSNLESGSKSGSGSSGSVWDAEGPGRREGAAAWEFSIFPPSPAADGGTAPGAGTAAAASAAKYVAPPRRLSGLVLVGAATRLPVVRDYITEVTGLPVRPGVDPETAVALGAALHAGLMVGSITRGIEMNDGGYVSEQHGRASGFQVAAAPAAAAAGGGGSGVEAQEVYDEPELVWEP